jgi:primosomal protein N' (replication factor Y)
MEDLPYLFADVILPLALPKDSYSYSLPEALAGEVVAGKRVEVAFGKQRIYSGIVLRVHTEKPAYAVKPVLSVLDREVAVTEEQLALWRWMAAYYCCSMGEVMLVALPGHLKLSSETMLSFNPAFGDDFSGLDQDGYLLAEALLIGKSFSLETARQVLNRRAIVPVIQKLLELGVLFMTEDLQEKFKPRVQAAVRLSPAYPPESAALKELFGRLDERQTHLLMAYIHLSRKGGAVLKRALLSAADLSASTLKTMVRKGYLEIVDQEVSRLGGYAQPLEDDQLLTDLQQQALRDLQAVWKEKQVALLRGVTGSGKTRIYLELIRVAMEQGGQVLYLLPEIGLTTQLVARLRRALGDDIVVYHSKINYHERVELWRSALAGKPVIIGARSALFLPFKQLSLIIVDEEHDPSFKQQDPAPRYHARDTAIYLATRYGARVLLGTATPALETYHNAQTGKYGLVPLTERFGGLALPPIQAINLKEQHHLKQMNGVFSLPMIQGIHSTLARGAQVILFQNRRGYAPVLKCQECQWVMQCRDCDVSLTYHLHSKTMRCHYCSYVQPPTATCPACGSGKLGMLGSGTEKIEDELRVVFPDARVARLDLDTAGSRQSMTRILGDFEDRQIDILVGTQMIAKGLDFDQVGMVGILGADQMVHFPDFRSAERAFQLLVQVAGRAGRKLPDALVLLQTYNPAHPVMQEVAAYNYDGFFARELGERRAFSYPPFTRIVVVRLRHQDPRTVAAAASLLAKMLRTRLGARVLGPVAPGIARVRNYYLQEIMLKLERSGTIIQEAKQHIRRYAVELQAEEVYRRVQVQVDVDPC